METFEVLKITNVGNADGKYKWDTTSKAFLIHPSSGIVPSGGSVETVITYRPTAIVGGKENQAGKKKEEGRNKSFLFFISFCKRSECV